MASNVVGLEPLLGPVRLPCGNSYHACEAAAGVSSSSNAAPLVTAAILAGGPLRAGATP